MKALDIEHSTKNINLKKGEQMAEDFLAINPAHVVPTIKDGDFVLWESGFFNIWPSTFLKIQVWDYLFLKIKIWNIFFENTSMGLSFGQNIIWDYLFF